MTDENEKDDRQDTVGSRFAKMRRRLGFNTQSEFGRDLGFDASNISLIEADQRKVSAKIMDTLEEKYKISRNWLKKGEGNWKIEDVPHSITYSNEEPKNVIENVIENVILNNKVQEYGNGYKVAVLETENRLLKEEKQMLLDELMRTNDRSKKLEEWCNELLKTLTALVANQLQNVTQQKSQ